MVLSKRNDLEEEAQEDYTDEELEEMESDDEEVLEPLRRGKPTLRQGEEKPIRKGQFGYNKTKPKTEKKQLIRYEAVHQAEITGIRDNESGQVFTDINVLTAILNVLDEINKKL